MKRTPLYRKTPLVRQSPKRRKEQRLRREFVRQQLDNRPLCEAGDRIRLDREDRFSTENADALGKSWGCQRWSSDIHEPLTRARGGSILDASNTIAVCRNCHDWIHTHPERATNLGFLTPSSPPSDDSTE